MEIAILCAQPAGGGAEARGGHQLRKAEEEPGTGLRLSKVGGSGMCKGPAQLALTSDHPGMFVGSAQGLAGDGRACR